MKEGLLYRFLIDYDLLVVNVGEVVSRLQNLTVEMDQLRKRHARTWRDSHQEIRDLQRDGDEQMRNFQTVSDVVDNIRTEIRDLKVTCGKLIEAQEHLLRRIDKHGQVDKSVAIDEESIESRPKKRSRVKEAI